MQPNYVSQTYLTGNQKTFPACFQLIALVLTKQRFFSFFTAKSSCLYLQRTENVCFGLFALQLRLFNLNARKISFCILLANHVRFSFFQLYHSQKMFPACFQLITPNKSADHTRSLVHIHKYHKVTLCYMMMDLGINAAIWSRHTKSSTTGTLKRTSALFTRSSIPKALKTTCSLYTRSRITRTLKRTSSFIRFQRAM